MGLDTQRAALQGRLDEINARLDVLQAEAADLKAEKQLVKAELADIDNFEVWKKAQP